MGHRRHSVGKLTTIGSDNGLAPSRRQANILTSAELLLTRPLETKFSEITFGNHIFLFMKMHLECRLRNGVNFVWASMWYPT